MKRSKRKNDSYEEVVDEHWADIVEVFRQFEEKHPILLFDIQEQQIYAYPFQDFAAELSARDQTALGRQHKKVVDGESIIVFVRDNQLRKLVSFTVARQSG